MARGSIRERADRLRATPLEAVLAAIGAQQDRDDPSKWRTARGTLSVTAPKFMNWTRAVGGGGAIDLVMHLEDLGFMDALEWLARRFPGGEHQSARPRRPGPCAPAGGLVLPTADPGKLQRVKHYLLAERRLPPGPIEALITAGTIYADARGNAVFLMHDPHGRPIGAELRGTSVRPWRSLARGTSRDRGYFCAPRTGASKVVICEAAIDALSCSTLHADSLCVSTAGARPNPRWLAALLQGHREILCGFDADAAGDEAARAMIALHPSVQRLRPALKDWNAVLQARS